jgi:hypothetical protein
MRLGAKSTPATMAMITELGSRSADAQEKLGDRQILRFNNMRRTGLKKVSEKDSAEKPPIHENSG